MDLAEAQAWFSAQTEKTKTLVLLHIVSLLTLVARDVLTTNDLDTRLQVLTIVSEITHRLAPQAIGILHASPSYPDDVLIGILFDHLRNPVFAPHAFWVWDEAVKQATRT